MRSCKYSLVIILLSLLSVTKGQQISTYSISDEEAFKFRVKQLTEFIDLFNNNIDYTSRGISAEQGKNLKREVILLNLFDLNDTRLIKDSANYSKQYEELASAFIRQVSENELHLTKSSEEIFAQAKTAGTFKGKAVKFDILLQQELVGKNMLKWSIADVHADFLEFLQKDTLMLRFLPPSSDELDFKELTRALKDLPYLDQYAVRDYSYDPLSVFFYLINTGELKVEAILEVKYKLLEIPGWEIELSDFNRISKNSGWLISDLKKR